MILTASTIQQALGCSAAVAARWAEPLATAFRVFSISNPKRAAAFLAQIGHESGSLSTVVENLNYGAQGLANTWPARYAVNAKARPLVPNQLARMLVSGGYRVPTEGRSTLPTLSSADIAAAVGLMRDRVAKDTVVAVATRADGAALARLSWPVYRQVARALRHDPMVTLKHDQPADRWRVLLVIHDAVRDLVWPERKVSAGLAAKAARMRKGDYLRVHRLAYSNLLEALEKGREEFRIRLFSTV